MSTEPAKRPTSAKAAGIRAWAKSPEAEAQRQAAAEAVRVEQEQQADADAACAEFLAALETAGFKATKADRVAFRTLADSNGARTTRKLTDWISSNVVCPAT